ncbi:MAG TPA: SoxR reducing system RseC family protein [Firmicutes bacterium]|nr:SoxR reducing system RseC family protein [Bacillota bacterium]
MQELGRIVKTEGNLAYVEVERRTACGRCQLCEIGRHGAAVIAAENPIGAAPGSRVMVEMETRNVLLAAFVAYMIPLFFMFAGFFVGSGLAPVIGLRHASQVVAGASGLIFLAGSYAIVHWYDKVTSRRGRRPRIVHICDDNQ